MGNSIAPQAIPPAQPGVLAQVTSPVTARLLRRSATARRVRYSRVKIIGNGSDLHCQSFVRRCQTL